MAKKDTVYIDIQTSDGGSMQRVAVSAKKLGLALDDAGKAGTRTGKSAKTLDRNLKGTADMTANSTKGFSKMAQGMTGTLVPAYAVLASNVFAITAAFQFLQRAADFRVMQESQVAFTAATGVGMQSLTKNIQDASGQMLSFQAASEAASIGIASGLGSGQIEELAAGAGNLSKILGRDVTDSFNRLVRGVTKAEPELLDELGITLRLADAQENYAAKLNKSAKDLTNYEKKQAVFSEVQTQLETKYGEVAKATDIQVNAISRLGIEFDRVMKKVKTFINAISEPTAEFLTENITGLAVALAALAVPIIKAIIPGLDNWAEKSKQAATDAGDAYKQAKQDIEDLERAQKKLEKKTGVQGAATAAGPAKKGSGLEMLQTGNAETLKKDKRRISQMLRHAEAGNGAIRKMNKRQAADYLTTLRTMERGYMTFSEKVGMGWRKITASASVQMTKMRAQWAATMAAMKGAAAKFSSGTEKIFRAAGWIGMLVLAYELSMQFAKTLGFFKESPEIKKLEQSFSDIGDSLDIVNEEYEKFVDVQKSLAKEGTALKALEAQGNFFQGITKNVTDAAQAMRDFSDGNLTAQKTNADLEKQLKASNIADLEAREGGGTKQTRRGTRSSGPGLNPEEQLQLENLRKMREEIKLFKEGLPEVGQASEELGRKLQPAINQALNLMNSLSENGGLNEAQEKYRQTLIAVQATLVAGKEPTQAQIDAIQELGDGFIETGRQASFLIQQQEELEKQFTQAINGITKYSTKVSSLQTLIEDQIRSYNVLQKRAGNEKKLTAEITKQKTELQGYLDTLEIIADEEIRINNAKIKDQTAFNAALHGATALQRESLGIDKKILDNLRGIEQLNLDIYTAQELSKNTADETVNSYRLQKEQLEEQNKLLEEQKELGFQVLGAGKQAFETGLQSSISALLKGEESSLKDALLGIAKGVVDSMIDAFAKGITSDIMGALGMETEAQKNARLLLEAHEAGGAKVKTEIEGGGTEASKSLESALASGAEKFKTSMDETADRFSEAIKEACSSSACMGHSGGDTPTTDPSVEPSLPGADDFSAENMERLRNMGPGLPEKVNEIVDDANPTPVKIVEDPLATTGVDPAVALGAGEKTGGVKKAEDAQAEALKENSGIMSKLTGETAKNVVGLGLAVTSLMGNSKAGQKLQKIMAALMIFQQAKFIWEKASKIREFILDRINNLSTSANTAAVIANTTVQSTSGGGGFMSFLAGLFGFGRSGIYPPMGYATGGIARGTQSGYPAILHGTEAVVPLPDGKSIPVTMPRGGGLGSQNNNVAVTVNMNGDGIGTTDTESDSREATALGERISAIVQEELMNQKRAGGILSPYGAA